MPLTSALTSYFRRTDAGTFCAAGNAAGLPDAGSGASRVGVAADSPTGSTGGEGTFAMVSIALSADGTTASPVAGLATTAGCGAGRSGAGVPALVGAAGETGAGAVIVRVIKGCGVGEEDVLPSRDVMCSGMPCKTAKWANSTAAVTSTRVRTERGVAEDGGAGGIMVFEAV